MQMGRAYDKLLANSVVDFGKMKGALLSKINSTSVQKMGQAYYKLACNALATQPKTTGNLLGLLEGEEEIEDEQSQSFIPKRMDHSRRSNLSKRNTGRQSTAKKSVRY